MSIIPHSHTSASASFDVPLSPAPMSPASPQAAGGSPVAASGRPLGTIGRISSKASGRAKKLSSFGGIDDPFVRRFMLQAAARDLMPREAVSKCLRAPIPTRALVDVLYSPCGDDDVGKSHLGGLQMCKSVWMCPLCAAKISERRRKDLGDGISNWYSQSGVRRVLLVTFTLSHKRNDNFSVVLSALKRARKLLVSGRWAAAFSEQHHIVGNIRALEITYGVNGWHPHLHVLYFLDADVKISVFEESIKNRWAACVAAAGKYASWDYGCDVRFSDDKVAEYVAKWGKEPKWSTAHEMTKAPVKSARADGLTPMQLLYQYAMGDNDAGRLWLQYAVVMKGERQLWWSHKLREKLGLQVDKTDEELMEEQNEVAIILAQLTHNEWRIVLANDARAELLSAARSGDALKVAHFLESLGIG